MTNITLLLNLIWEKNTYKNAFNVREETWFMITRLWFHNRTYNNPTSQPPFYILCIFIRIYILYILHSSLDSLIQIIKAFHCFVLKRISLIRLLIFKCKICNFFLENISFEIIFFSVEVRITAFIRHSWFITVTKLMIFKNVLLLILQSHNSIFKFFYCFFLINYIIAGIFH